MSIKPVGSWSSDFDISDPGYETDPYPIWDELRQSCPVAHTDRRGSTYLPTTWETITAVAYDTENFSSRDVGVFPPPEGSKALISPPITSDPPFHAEARRLLLPHFSPKAVARLEPQTLAIATELLDALDGRATADAASDYAQHIPVRVIAHLLGIPAEDEAMFTGWAIEIFQHADDFERLRTATKAVLAYFEEQVADRQLMPGNDLVSELLRSEIDGAQPCTQVGPFLETLDGVPGL
jgi:cytochrome P450